MSVQFDEKAFDKAETFDEKRAVHQQHWQQVAAYRAAKLEELKQVIRSSWECCGEMWLGTNICGKCRNARVF